MEKKMEIKGIIRIIKGLCKGYIRIIVYMLGFYRENGKGN